MKANNFSDNIKQMDINNETDKKKTETSNTQNPSYKTGKGTGMSNEAGSEQSEKSWQDKSGSDTNWQTGDSRNESTDNSINENTNK